MAGRMPWFKCFADEWLSRISELTSPQAISLAVVAAMKSWSAERGAATSLHIKSWAKLASISTDEAVEAANELAGQGWVECRISGEMMQVCCKFLAHQLHNRRTNAARMKRVRETCAVEEDEEADVDVGVDEEVDLEEESKEPRPKTNTSVADAPSLPRSEPPQDPASKKPKSSPEVEAVVAHYVSLRPNRRPGNDERRKIAARLKEGFTVEHLKQAIDGCLSAPYQNPDSGKVYDSLELIVRNSSKVNQYAEMHAPRRESPQFGSLEELHAWEAVHGRVTVDGGDR